MTLDDAARVLHERNNGRREAWPRMTEGHKDLYREDFMAALAAFTLPERCDNCGTSDLRTCDCADA